MVVGAWRDDDACPLDPNCNSGSAYVFGRDQGGANNWGQVKKLTASDAAAFDVFGWSVAISGETVMVAAPNDDDAGSFSGSAYVFELVPPVAPSGLAVILNPSDSNTEA